VQTPAQIVPGVPVGYCGLRGGHWPALDLIRPPEHSAWVFDRREMDADRKARANAERAARGATDAEVLEDAERLIARTSIADEMRIDHTRRCSAISDVTSVLPQQPTLSLHRNICRDGPKGDMAQMFSGGDFGSAGMLTRSLRENDEAGDDEDRDDCRCYRTA
jgi:hypothetical protein